MQKKLAQLPTVHSPEQTVQVHGSGHYVQFYENDLSLVKSVTDFIIGGLIKCSAKKNLRIRAFGEMVAILWGQGHRSAAIHLEDLWNELGKQYSFSLYCAYPLHR